MHRKDLVHPSHTQVLLESLLEAPLLVGDLDLSSSFDRSALHSGRTSWKEFELNYQQKLGHLYEDVLSFLLESADSLTLLGKSIQVFNDNKITQGELDYVLEKGGRLIHLELAVKFYLAFEKDGVVSYPGPDPRDNWDNKLKRLQSHQLSMARSEFGRKIMLENYGSEEVEVQHLIYGKLFSHLSTFSDGQLPPLPNEVSNRIEFQKWIYLSEWDDFFLTDDAHLIPKHLWPIAPHQFDEGLLATLPVYNRAELGAMMKQHPSCMMVWLQEAAAPIFLVPEHWPEAR